MGDALGVLGLMVFVGALFVVVAALSGAASRYDQRRKGRRVVQGSIWGDIKSAVVAICMSIGAVVAGIAGCLANLIGCVLFLVLGLVGLFFIVWLVKQMWEVA